MVNKVNWITNINLLPPSDKPILVTVDPTDDPADRYLDICWYSKSMDCFTASRTSSDWAYQWCDIAAWAYQPTVYGGDRRW